MPSSGMVYCDTCALVKRYVSEPPSSRKFEEFMFSNLPLVISTLTISEVRSTLAKTRREKKGFTRQMEKDAFILFHRDIQFGHLWRVSLEDAMIEASSRIIELVDPDPLHTLDAIHLAVVTSLGIRRVATADRRFAHVLRGVGIEVISF